MANQKREGHAALSLRHIRQTDLLAIDYLANCLVIVVFLGHGRETSPLGQVHASQRPASPAYLAHTSTVSPYYDTSRDRLQSSRITKPPNGTVPFDSSTPPNSSRKP